MNFCPPLKSMRDGNFGRDLGEMLVKADGDLTKQVDITKVGRGAFNTKGDSWLNTVVRDFIEKECRPSYTAVDPFAGKGDMLTLCESELGMDTYGYDIQKELGWEINDSLVSVPRRTAAICITNPPYLAKYSARRKSMWPMVGKYYEDSGRSDLYEIALDKCLGSFDHVVAIIPETFLHSTYPKDRCQSIVILEENPFEDTTFPVCVTCWVPKSGQDPEIYVGGERVMRFSEMVRMKGSVARNNRVLFNCPHGNVGLKAVDGVDASDRIKFLPADEFYYPRSSIKVSSRLMTYLNIPELDTKQRVAEFCETANQILGMYRSMSDDIILSGFKGNNKDGKRRRRLDYKLARKVILEALGTPVQTTLTLD